MKCLVLFLTVVVVVEVRGAATCSRTEELFSRLQISADDSDEPGPICEGHCCGRGREKLLGVALRKSAEKHVVLSTRAIAELLLSTRRTLQDHLIALSHQSQNKTSVLLSQVYRGHSARTHAPLATLYEDIRQLLQSGPERDVIDEGDLGSPPPKDLTQSTRQFFRDIFPVAYRNILKLESKQLTPEYEACLKDAYDGVQPFRDVPQQLGTKLTRALEATRSLFQVMAVGAGVLQASEQVLASTNEHCTSKVLRLGGCARCLGHEARPCRNYCLNVARGCLGSLVADLDAPWTRYVEGVERLAKAEADAALRSLDSKVSDAVLYAMEQKVILEKKVRQDCGPHTVLDAPGPPEPRPTPASRRDALRAPPPDAEMLQFTATLAASKKLFATLSDRMCDQVDFANEGNTNCWNGDTIGEYTKALVASSALRDQKYNPEVFIAPEDTRIADLGNKLLQARQVLLSHSWGGSSLPAESIMQGDEAGDEGSGSGKSYTDDDAAYDAEGSGEGSGVRETGIRTYITDEKTTYTSTTKPSSATTSRPLSAFVLSFITVLGLRHCIT